VYVTRKNAKACPLPTASLFLFPGLKKHGVRRCPELEKILSDKPMNPTGKKGQPFRLEGGVLTVAFSGGISAADFFHVSVGREILTGYLTTS